MSVMLPEGSSQYHPLTPNEEKAVEGLTFRAGEIDHTIQMLRDFIGSSFSTGSSSRISKLLNKIGLGAEARVVRSLQQERKQIGKMLDTLGYVAPLSSKRQSALPEDVQEIQKLLKAKKTEKNTLQSTIKALNTQKDALSKHYNDAIVFKAISTAGLGEIGPSNTQKIIDQMDKLNAQLQGLEHSLRKVDVEIRALEDKSVTLIENPEEQFTQAVENTRKRITSKLTSIQAAVAKKTDQVERASLLARYPLKRELSNLQVQEAAAKTDLSHLHAFPEIREAAKFLSAIRKDLLSKNMVDFVSSNWKKDFICLHGLRDGSNTDLGLKRQRQELIEAINIKLKSLDGTTMPVIVPCTQLRNTIITEDAATKGADRKWIDAIPDYTACRTTLGRRDLTVVRLEGKALVDPQVDEMKAREVARVAHVSNQLEQEIKNKWPGASEAEVTKLVADTVTLMAIDHNYTSVLTDLATGIRMRLTTDEEMTANRRIVPGASTNPEYELILGTGDKPSCTVICTKKFKDMEGDDQVVGNYTLKSTFSRGIDDSSFTGTVAITSN